MENIMVFFLLYIEEGAALAFLGPALFGIRPEPKKIVLMGVLQGIMIYLARNILAILKVTPFVHTIILLLSLIIIIRLVTGANWGIASAGGILGFIILMVSETMFIPFVWPLLGLTFEKLAPSPWLHILSAYISCSPLFILTVIVGITKFSFIKPKIN